ncbi:suppressor of glycerol defect [Coemansia sp. RSA 370]|nr:suppressor of glycerol defect [Coemansia sp. RSA 370]KAJ2293007.1 suppressor of glycerol defect [Coemansia sp. RSA 355]
MPPKRKIQPNALLPASLAKKLAEGDEGSDKRYSKRFKNTAGSRKAARKQARDDKKQRKNDYHKRARGAAAPEKAEVKPKPANTRTKPTDPKSKPTDPKAKPVRPTTTPVGQKTKPEDDRAQLVKFAKRNQGMYALLRESNLIGDVDNEVGVVSKAVAAEDLEDREMRRLERHLGIKSNSALGSAFFEEGLGEVLGGMEFGSAQIRKSLQKPAADSKANREANDELQSGSDDSEMSVVDEDGSGVDSDDDMFGLNGMDEDDGSESDDSDIADMYKSQGVEINPSLSDVESNADDSDEDDSDEDDSDEGDSEDDILDEDNSEDDILVESNSEDNSDIDESESASDEEMGVVEEKAVSANVGRYIPPSLRRKQTEEVEDERVVAIRKTLQGQLNRLSESNIEGIVLQIEAQYQKYPRHHVTSVLTSLILQSIESRIHMLDTFLYVNAAIVGAVFRIVGLEPVAHLVQKLMEEFEQRFTQSMTEFKAAQGAEASEGDAMTTGKECQNLCVFVAELYNFQVISCQLVYDVIRLCIKDINEFTAELLLKLIRISGQQLRKDDPLALKEIVRQVTETIGASGKLSVRCKFMVESLTSLKDNRMRNEMSQNAENVARLRRFLGNMDKRRAVGAVEPINIGLQDIRDVETKGKWWLVGSSWVGNQYTGDTDGPTALQKAQKDSDNAEMERLLKMAREQHMNTDIRRSIFITLLSSDDYADAFERLLKLDLKNAQAREMMRVILHCSGQEQAYNPYYTLVAYKLCSYHNTYRLTMQYALWDFLRELGESDVGGLGRISEESSSLGANVPLRRIVNLAKTYAWLVDKQVLSLLILKTVTFARVGEQARVFFQVMFSTLFLLHKKQSAQDVQAVYSVFQRAVSNPTMCHGILFFFQHFVKNCELVSEDERPIMKWGCKVAKQAIRSGVGSTSFDDM